MNIYIMNIGKNIKKLRQKYGMTQKDLAVRLSISEQAVSKWENQRSAPNIMLLPEIAGIFGILIDELFV